MKKFFLTSILFSLCMLPILSFAQTPNDFEIIPKATSGDGVGQAVEAVGKTGGSVRDTYNEQAEAMEGKV